MGRNREKLNIDIVILVKYKNILFFGCRNIVLETVAYFKVPQMNTKLAILQHFQE